MNDDSTRLALQTRLGWYGLAEKQGLTTPKPAPTPTPAPRTAAEAIYPHLAEAARKETSR